MKKLIMFLCAGLMSLSVTGCGSSSNIPVSLEQAIPLAYVSKPIAETLKVAEASKTSGFLATPKKSEISAYGKNKEAILELVDVAYTGFTTSNEKMYFLADNKGENVALLVVNADEKGYIKFDGSAEIDDDSGVMTITDRDKGYMFSFTAEKQANGSFLLDCGNLGHAYLKAAEPEKVVEAVITLLQTMEDTTDELMYTIAKMNLVSTLESAYSGLTAVQAPMYFLISGDGEFAALVLVSSNENEYISFIGSAEVDEDTGIITVTDSEKGYTFSFLVEDLGDGSYFLDCGNLGECYLELDDIETVVEYIDSVFIEMEDVTDMVVEEIGN